MSAPSHKISLPRIILVWCQTRLASGAGKAHKKKSISDNARDRKLAAAQIRLPTFDKRKRANFVHPSNGCSPIHSSRGYENARARAGEAERGVRGKSFQPLDSLMEGEEKNAVVTHSMAERKPGALFPPRSSLVSIEHSR